MGVSCVRVQNSPQEVEVGEAAQKAWQRVEGGSVSVALLPVAA